MLCFAGSLSAGSQTPNYDYYTYFKHNPVLGGDKKIKKSIKSVRSFYSDEYKGRNQEVFSFGFHHQSYGKKGHDKKHGKGHSSHGKGHGHGHSKYSKYDVDSFWTVVSPGADPKSNKDEYVIFYGDLKNNKLTSYVYDGKDSADSYKSSKFLGSHTLSTKSVNKDTKWTSFTLDVTAMNNLNLGPDWQGAKFGENIGIWFHPSSDSKFNYNKDGSISKFSYSKQGWFDVSNQQTCAHISSVPEPNQYALFILGAMSVIYFRKKKTLKFQA